MAKDKERKSAYNLYVNECLMAKEIALRLKVTEKTIGDWVREGNWKQIRLSKQTTADTLSGKYDDLLSALLDRRLSFEKKPSKSAEEKEEHRNIIDEMSKIAAIKDRIHKDGNVSLRVHIHCMEKFMAYIHTHNPKLFMNLIDHQRDYLVLLTEELK
ncbi:MAG: hypothetical protein JNK73_13170 [Bacteroidia bacterium]|nr:hypothetical protein [Bacteroidia bacterium]